MPTIATEPGFMQAHSTSAQEVRRLVPALGDAGVLGSADLAVTQRAAGANMTVDVAGGSCIIPGAIGSYLCRNPTSVSVPVAAAPGVGNSRIDVVYAQIRDDEIDGGGLNEWKIDVVTGTPSGTPSVPALPSAYAIELARITLTSSTTSITNGIITNTRRHSAAPADTRWPVVGVDTPADVNRGAGVNDWGSVTIAAPNRPVKVFAWFDCYASAEPGGINSVPTLAIRVTHSGSTVLVTTPIKSLSPTEFDTVNLSRSMYASFTPAVGTSVVVDGRVQSESGADADFKNGRLMVQVFPA